MVYNIRFKNTNTPAKWLKAHKYQIKYVENYINYGIHPSTLSVKIKFTHFIKKEDTKTIYTTYVNEYGETVEMLFDTPEKVAYINRITDF